MGGIGEKAGAKVVKEEETKEVVAATTTTTKDEGVDTLRNRNPSKAMFCRGDSDKLNNPKILLRPSLRLRFCQRPSKWLRYGGRRMVLRRWPTEAGGWGEAGPVDEEAKCNCSCAARIWVLW